MDEREAHDRHAERDRDRVENTPQMRRSACHYPKRCNRSGRAFRREAKPLCRDCASARSLDISTGVRSWNQLCACTKPFTLGRHGARIEIVHDPDPHRLIDDVGVELGQDLVLLLGREGVLGRLLASSSAFGSLYLPQLNPVGTGSKRGSGLDQADVGIAERPRVIHAVTCPCFREPRRHARRRPRKASQSMTSNSMSMPTALKFSFDELVHRQRLHLARSPTGR